MDGLLVVDKPVGPTSHDVVARVRRALGADRAGHTGTLDPGASGVLPVVLGRATRLARFMSGQDKTYRATIRLGIETDTYDSAGAIVAPRFEGPWPHLDAIERALEAFRGTFLQQPPAYSAKKIAGERSYRLARRRTRRVPPAPPAPPGLPDLPGPPALPAPVNVTVRRLDLLEVSGDHVTLEIECVAGFYVRSLAHDLGRALGIGAHLTTLERLASGDLRLDKAIGLAQVEEAPETARSMMVPLALMLPDLPACRLTSAGVGRVGHGQDLRPVDFEARPLAGNAPFLRLFGPAGDLVGVGEPARTPGFLHPLIVLM